MPNAQSIQSGLIVAGAACIYLFTSCFAPRHNPMDPDNPDASRFLDITLDCRYQASVSEEKSRSLVFSFDKKLNNHFGTAWKFDFNNDGFDDTSCAGPIDHYVLESSDALTRPFSVQASLYGTDNGWGSDTLVVENTWERFDAPNEGAVNGKVTALAIDSANDIWIAIDSILYQYNGAEWTVHDEAKGFITNGKVTSIVVDSAGRVLVGARYGAQNEDKGGGLYAWNGQSWYGLSDNAAAVENVGSIVLNEPHLWYVQNDSTIIYRMYEKGNFLVAHKGVLVAGKDSLPATNFLSLAIEPGGRLWIGTNGEGLLVFNAESNTFERRYTANNTGIEYLDRINKVIIGPDSAVWVATQWGVARLYDSEWTVYPHIPDMVKTIAFDYYGNLWFGGLNGLCRFNPSTEQFEIFSQDTTTGTDMSVKEITIDGRHRVWIGTELGLLKYYHIETME